MFSIVEHWVRSLDACESNFMQLDFNHSKSTKLFDFYEMTYNHNS